MLALPLAPLDPRPSVTVFKCIVEQVALSTLLLALESAFAQQSKDSTRVQKEVMREYDVKYVHPRLHPVVRDVGVQCEGEELDFVEPGTPNTLIRRSFKTNPNPNYLAHVDPDNVGHTPSSRSSGSPLVMATPINRPKQPEMFTSIHKPRPSPLRQSMPASINPPRTFSPEKSTITNAIPARALSTEKPVLSNASTNTGTNYGGSLGVFSHSRSPLKKAASINEMRNTFSPRNSRELAAIEQRDLAERMIRKSSPMKENRRSGLSSSIQYDSPEVTEPESSPNPFANMGKHRGRLERFPSRW